MILASCAAANRGSTGLDEVIKSEGGAPNELPGAGDADEEAHDDEDYQIVSMAALAFWVVDQSDAVDKLEPEDGDEPDEEGRVAQGGRLCSADTDEAR